MHVRFLLSGAVVGLSCLAPLAIAQESTQPQAWAPAGEEGVKVEVETATVTAPPAEAACQPWMERYTLSGTYDVTLHTHTSTMLMAVPQGLEHYQLTVQNHGCKLEGELIKVGENNTLFPASKRKKVPVDFSASRGFLEVKTLPGVLAEDSAVQRLFRIVFQLNMEDRTNPQPLSFYGLWRDGLDQQAPSQWGPIKGVLRQKAKGKVKAVKLYKGLCDHQQFDAKGKAPAFTLSTCELGQDGGIAFVHHSDIQTFMNSIDSIPETPLASGNLTSASLSRVEVDLSQDKLIIRGELAGRVVDKVTKKPVPELDYILPVLLTFNDEGNWAFDTKDVILLQAEE